MRRWLKVLYFVSCSPVEEDTSLPESSIAPIVRPGITRMAAHTCAASAQIVRCYIVMSSLIVHVATTPYATQNAGKGELEFCLSILYHLTSCSSNVQFHWSDIIFKSGSLWWDIVSLWVLSLWMIMFRHPAWISNYIHYKDGGEITYPFQNLNVCTVEVRELISNFISHFTVHVIIYPYLD